MAPRPHQPRFPISGLQSVDLAVPDLSGAEDFYIRVWGLTVAGRGAGRVYPSGTGREPWLVALRDGPVAINCVT